MDKEYVIGVDLGGTNVRCGLIGGQQISKITSAKISSGGTENEVVQELIHSIEEVIQDGVLAIGIGVPGIVDTARGIVYDVQNIPSWKEVHLKTVLEQHFKIPVLINNDANCFAAGEQYYGEAKGYDHVVGLILGTGVAAGIICNGNLHEGRNCGAGEFGMLPYLDHNYEFYCSGNYFRHFHDISGELAFSKATAGDPAAVQMFQEYGKHISMVIRAVLYTVDPEIIVLGGSVSKAFPFFKESLWANLQDFPYKPVIQNIIIKATETNNIAVLGAAALLMNANRQR